MSQWYFFPDHNLSMLFYQNNYSSCLQTLCHFDTLIFKHSLASHHQGIRQFICPVCCIKLPVITICTLSYKTYRENLIYPFKLHIKIEFIKDHLTNFKFQFAIYFTGRSPFSHLL